MKTLLLLLAASVAYGQIAATNAHPRFPCVGCAVDQDHHPDLPCTDPNWVKTGTCVVVDPPQSPITSQSIPAAPATPCTLKDKNGRVLEYGVQVKEGCDLTNATPVLPAKPYDLMLECKKLPTGADHAATTGTAEHHWFMAFVEGEHQWSYDCWEAPAETKPEAFHQVYDPVSGIQHREIPFCGYSAPGEDCVKLPDGFQLMPSLPFNAMPESKP